MSIKWILVDANNLPEDEVIAIDKEGHIVVGFFMPSSRSYSPPHRLVVAVQDDEGRVVKDVHSFIPMKHLTKLWREQNQVVPNYYSKKSKAYEILSWHMEEGVLKEPWNSGLLECPLKATKLIRCLANSMVLNYFVYPSKAKLIAGDTQIMDELVYWLKEYIAANK